jgi:hypothetical protein
VRRIPAPPPSGVLYALFVVAGLLMYAPVLDGGFISDDSHYVQRNEYVHDLSVHNLVAIWDPGSEVTVLVENYAPVHLMLHAFEWQAFGPDVFGYHVVNVVLHALAAVLLVPIYRRSAIGAWPAVLGASFFLVHPSNVESVAWISQLKSSSALVLSLLALLWHPRRPLAALVAFALALFAKPFAAFALPVVALFGWVRGRSAEASDRPESAFRWGWLAGWLCVVGLFAFVESYAFNQSAGLAPPLYADLVERYMTIFAVLSRYALMTVCGIGLSTFHEPLPVTSISDPAFLSGVLIVAGLGWRTLVTLARGSEEAVYWLWAAISMAPLSGVLPLPYPMADRYLYFVLPGLIGGACLAWRDDLSPWLERVAGAERARLAARIATLAIVALLAVFSAQTYRRAPVYRSADALMTDAELNYPDGVAAHTRRAGRAAAAGDVDGAIAHLRAAWSRGYNRVDHLIADPRYAILESEPDFVALKNEMADDWISRLDEDPAMPHYKSRALAQAYVAKGDLEGALRVIESAARRPGPIAGELAADAEELRRRIAFEQRLEAQRPGRIDDPGTD